MQKALREAKTNTSWRNPAAAYEAGVAAFVRALLVDERGAPFRAELSELVGRIAGAGSVNGLAQLMLKATLPGVPDFYQGTEFWDFNLVDPDNRRPVDFARRQVELADLVRRHRETPLALVEELARDLQSDRTKLFVTWRTLATRRDEAETFGCGTYEPLAVTGARQDHVLAFARRFQERCIAVVVPRQIQCLLREAGGSLDWGDTTVKLPLDANAWRHTFTGAVVERSAQVQDLLYPLPVAVLTAAENREGDV
jgi:(1->4)-alpha-D-glucan 1-alpha-D-glucosylmutase